MSQEMSLFDDNHSLPERKDGEPAAATPAAPWQLDLLRKALDARGLTEMNSRQRAVESAIGRPVESLAALTSKEAILALRILNTGRRPERERGSAWEQRDHDTWIDRL